LNPAADLLEALSPPSRLALAYAPGPARLAWLALLSLDARLAAVVRGASEPLIGQIRLAWWRERLSEPSSNWPAGEPLLALLREWGGGHEALRPMVDGWEILLGEAPLSAEAFAEAAAGRAACAVALAERLGLHRNRAQVARVAREWALADFAAKVGDPRELAVLEGLVQDTGRARLPRSMRPLVVLHGLARRSRSGSVALLAALRLGILGR
jgi:15-cis-phytoene synthase